MRQQVHPSIPAHFVGYTNGRYGQNTPEYRVAARAMQFMAEKRQRFIEFAVLDDTHAPRYKRGDMLVLDMKRADFLDGCDYVFDFDHQNAAPRLESWQKGLPLRFYPSVYSVQVMTAGLRIFRGDPVAIQDVVPRSVAEEFCLGRVVASMRLHGSVS
jgi:hypothetical protein